MSFRSRHRPCAGQRGFTLVELLVVMLILGLLAAIALPAFINQRGKGYDAEAKTVVRNARQALEAFQTDRGTYQATVPDLIDIEPALQSARNLQLTATATTFTVSVDTKPSANSGGTYSIELLADGTVIRDCSNHGRGSCRATADSGGNYW
jgi:type IV pilus assembly protein PilA